MAAVTHRTTAAARRDLGSAGNLPTIGQVPSTRRGLSRARLAVLLTFAVNGMVFPSWAPRIPEVKEALQLSPGMLGLLLFAAPAGAMIAMPLVGAACSHFGSGRVTRWLLIGYTLTAVGVGLAPETVSFAVALFVVGATTGGMDVAMNAQGVTVEQALGRPVLNGFHAAWSLGALLGAGVGSVGAGLAVPLAVQLGGLGVIGLVVGLLAARAYLPDRTHDPAADSSAPVRFARPSGPLLLLGLAALAALMAEGAAADWTAVYLKESLFAGPAVAGWAYAAFQLTMTLGRMVGDRVVARFGRVATIRAGAAIGVVGLSGGLATGSVAGTIAGFATLGIGLAVVVPTLFGAAGEGPGPAGPAIAAVSTCGYAGWLAGPVVFGGVAEVVGLPVAMWLLPVLTLLGGVLAPVGIRAFRSAGRPAATAAVATST